jgi:two-component system sensor histidine kinase DegS
VEVALYRIAQESITNALKHAAAKHILIRLSYSEGSVEVIVRDDGRGFEINTLSPVGIGFVSMRERADIIGAKLTVHSTPGKGTEIRIALANEPDGIRAA